jgi:hypothetical protein
MVCPDTIAFFLYTITKSVELFLIQWCRNGCIITDQVLPF